MTTYQICSNGNYVGDYEANSHEDALQALAEDAGYDSIEEACAVGASELEDFEVYEAK